MITMNDPKRPKRSDGSTLLPESTNLMDESNLGPTRAQHLNCTIKPPLNVLTETFLPQEVTSVIDVNQKGLVKTPLPQDCLQFVSNRVTSSSPRNRTTDAQHCVYCLANVAHPRLGRGESYACGYKPYRCEICNYSTVTKGNLAIHEQSDKHLNNVQDYDQQQSLQYLKSLEESSVGVMTEFKNGKTTNVTLSLEKDVRSPYITNQEVPLNLDVQGSSSSEQDPYAPFNGGPRLLPPVIHSFNPLSLKSNGKLTTHSPQPLGGTKNVSIHVENFLSLAGDSDLIQTQHLAETMSQPLVCLICSAFCTDNPVALIEHAERSRTPLDLEAANQQVTTHSEGMWHCRVCTYRSALKANFQLHCKTEKHAQRLSLLVHIWEGLPANTPGETGVFCSQQSGAVDISSAFAKCLQIISISGSASASSIASSSCTITTPSPSPLSASSASSSLPYQVSAFVQLRCLACGFFSSSVHKFRVHCQTLNHVRFARLFSLIAHKRNELRASLVSFTQAYLDHLKTVPSLPVVQIADGASEQKAVAIVNSATVQSFFNLMAELKVIYACRSCLQGGPAEITEDCYWLSVTEAMRHFRSEKHQCRLQTFEGNVSSPVHIGEVEILWELAGERGTADQIPAVITRFLMESAGTKEDIGPFPADPKVRVANKTGAKLGHETDASYDFAGLNGAKSASGGSEKCNGPAPDGLTSAVRESEVTDVVIQKSGSQLRHLQKETVVSALFSLRPHPACAAVVAIF
ncbi:unnamed protein product [Schistocephalus solidus]|uniref:C2H2-type domain-containing protein n=1 Tax=Schistocephalus solidus TaxID=70667 RepID=A0A183SCW0_SCHSO|nr:unnamed protein product [Schistocephalus solidus]